MSAPATSGKKSRRFAVPWMALALLALLGAVAAAYLHRGGAQTRLVSEVRAERFSEVVRALGEVAPGAQTDVRAPTAPYERPVTWLAPEGSFVKAGDLLATFDTQDAEAHLEAQRERVVFLENTQEVEKLTWEIDLTTEGIRKSQKEESRQTAKLRKEGTVQEPPLPREIGEREFNVADMTTQQAERRIGQLEKVRDVELRRRTGNIRYRTRKVAVNEDFIEQYTVRSPVDSVVLYPPIPVGGGVVRKVQAGDNLARGQVFMTLPSLAGGVVRLWVPEREIDRIREGARAVIKARAFPEKSFEGVVTAISNLAVEGASRPHAKFFEVTAEVVAGDDDGLLKPGMIVEAEFPLREHESVFAIPRDLARVGAQGGVTILVEEPGGSLREVLLPADLHATADYLLVDPTGLPGVVARDGDATLRVVFKPAHDTGK